MVIVAYVCTSLHPFCLSDTHTHTHTHTLQIGIAIGSRTWTYTLYICLLFLFLMYTAFDITHILLLGRGLTKKVTSNNLMYTNNCLV